MRTPHSTEPLRFTMSSPAVAARAAAATGEDYRTGALQRAAARQAAALAACTPAATAAAVAR